MPSERGYFNTVNTVFRVVEEGSGIVSVREASEAASPGFGLSRALYGKSFFRDAEKGGEPQRCAL
jgi:molybdopterin/thiamine biosynthesis adenylyltransferase